MSPQTTHAIPQPYFFSTLQESREPGPTVKIQASRADVVRALRLVAETHPDTWSAMAVAEALLMRLDTIRDEAGFMGSLVHSHAAKGDLEVSKRTLDTLHMLLGSWDQKYSLAIQRK